MAIQITHIRFRSVAPREDTIDAFKWQTDEGYVGESTKLAMVQSVEAGDAVYVASGQTRVAVAVVKPDRTPWYLRTHADGEWTNNLLSLPTF